MIGSSKFRYFKDSKAKDGNLFWLHCHLKSHKDEVLIPKELLNRMHYLCLLHTSIYSAKMAAEKIIVSFTPSYKKHSMLF